MTEVIYSSSEVNTSNRELRVDVDDFVEIAKALSSDLRVAMFKELLMRSMNVGELAEFFGIPPSTAALNIKRLEDAKLIRTELVPGTRGTQKLCAAVYSRIVMDTNLYVAAEVVDSSVTVSMPIGQFSSVKVTPTCGLVSDSSIIGELDDPRAFYEPDRVNAQLIWFRTGYLEYYFPNRLPHGQRAVSIELSMEICSEAPLHNPNWPSDITLWINGVEIGTWTSPGDFGGEPGLLTPGWWGLQNTQYGLLKTWRVNESGSYIDGKQMSDVVISQLAIEDTPYIVVRVGVKDDAVNDGGINLFGSKFGNYPSDIVMRLTHSR
jgi:predicted transcriptional regulator